MFLLAFAFDKLAMSAMLSISASFEWVNIAEASSTNSSTIYVLVYIVRKVIKRL